MFKRIAAISTQHPWMVIVVWAVAVAVVLLWSPSLSSYTSNDNATFLPSTYQSVEAQNVAAHYFPAEAHASGVIVVSSTTGGSLSADQQSTVDALAQSLESDEISSVSSVSTSSELLSSDHTVQLVDVGFSSDVGTTGQGKAVPTIRAKTDAYLSDTGLTGGLTGNEAISVDSTSAFARAEHIVSIATVVMILILLGMIFRSIVIAVLPLAVIGVMHQMAQALTADLARWFHFVVGPELQPLLVVVMFGVGTDYIVFLLFRYRGQLASEEATDALRHSLATIGKVIASAALTVMGASAALTIASLESLRTLAPGLVVGIFLMLLAALTLVPSILQLVGHRVFWPSHPVALPVGQTRRAQRVGSSVARHPVRTVTVCAGILALLVVGIIGYATTYNQLAELPGSTPAQIAYDTMSGAFPAGELGPTQVYVSSNSGAALDQTAVATLRSHLETTTGVSSVGTPLYSTGGGHALLQVILKDNPYSVAAMDDVAGPLTDGLPEMVPNATTLIGGTTSQLADVRTALRHDVKRIIPLALGIMALILGLLLQAVIAPLVMLLGIVAVYTATLGVTAVLFLRGFGIGGLDFTIPIIVYLFVAAIGTDYNILVASRIREERDDGGSARGAAKVAIDEGAPAVRAAAVILAGTFASLLLTGIQLLEEIGFAVAIGVLLAATVLATRITPAVSILLERCFWWPHRSVEKSPDSLGLMTAPKIATPDRETGGLNSSLR